MSLVALTIPEEFADQVVWLERMLVGPDLGRLVAELHALHGLAPADAPALETVLGQSQAHFLTRGLEGLSAEQLRTLLRRPALLLELRERILTQGGPYWEGLLLEDDDTRAAVERGRQRLEAAVTPKIVTPARRSNWDLQTVLLCVATAAVVLLAVRLWDTSSRATPDWGWAHPGALPQKVSRAEYFRALAAGAAQWFDRRPEDAVALARRIDEFRRGCTVLLLSDHPSLDAGDRDWLKERCRAWAGKLDVALVDLEAGKDAASVRAGVDKIAEQLVNALNGRAAG